MTSRLAIAAAVVLLAAGTRGQAADAVPAAISAQIDGMVKVISQMPQRAFGKSVGFCAAQHLPADVALDARLAGMVSAITVGSRNALLEIARTDPRFLKAMPMPNAQDTAVMDKRGDQMLANVKASPAESCAKLVGRLQAQNPEFFKELVMKDFRAYEARRTQQCAATPKPADCP